VKRRKKEEGRGRGETRIRLEETGKKRTRGGVDILISMFVTLAVLHFEISALNASAQ
jgi:hypothetical protein